MNLPITDLTAGCCPPLTEGILSDPDADALATTLKVLADPVRLRLISILAAAPSGEVCACDLPAALGRSQSTVSHHLTQLTGEGILRREQRGKWAWFRLDRPRLSAIATALAPTPPPDPAPSTGAPRLRAPRC
ncbi:MAG: metalloregulator ArsR/SmtB family transcription factor [Sporichthyaceae bacterium]